MSTNDFEERRNKILGTIIEAYIDTAMPVGSESISRAMRQVLSSATIRNIMAELEEGGLLEQPHTSAGRVPTDQGYRLYVDSLMESRRLSSEELRELTKRVMASAQQLEGVFERAGTTLAELSHEVAFVVVPTVKHSTVRQIELMPLGVRKLLCVFVAQEAIIASHVVEIEEPMTRDEAVALAQFLNQELSGLPIQELLDSLERRLLAVNDSFYYLLKRSVTILQMALATEPEERFLVEGAAYLFEQPEFRRNPLKAYRLLQQLESGHELLALIRTDLISGDRAVRIGREVQVTGLEDFSYILVPFGTGQGIVGGVGVLGPKRMDYRRVCALVEATAALVTDTLKQWERQG